MAVAMLGGLQGSPIDGTWELARVFRTGPAGSTRVVPVDSTVFLRLSLESHQGDWISGRLDRRYRGALEHSRIEAGPLRGTGRWIIGAEIERPASARVRTAAWLAGDVLRLGTGFVPDADSLELRRTAPGAREAVTVVEVVTPP